FVPCSFKGIIFDLDMAYHFRHHCMRPRHIGMDTTDIAIDCPLEDNTIYGTETVKICVVVFGLARTKAGMWLREIKILEANPLHHLKRNYFGIADSAANCCRAICRTIMPNIKLKWLVKCDSIPTFCR